MEKIRFSALTPSQRAKELYVNPDRYSFIHNFRVHFKRGAMQFLANKVDISMSSDSPDMPRIQQVTDEFNRRMTLSVMGSQAKKRYTAASFQITDVQYVGSFALRLPEKTSGFGRAPSDETNLFRTSLQM
jgi:hypothetical protein